MAKVGGLVVLAMALLACASATLVDGQPLTGAWRATSVDAWVPVAGKEPTIVFDGDLVHGSGGCNSYASQRAPVIDGHRFDLGTTLQTAGRCIESNGNDTPEQSVELHFFEVLDAVDHIAFRGYQLILSGPKGEIDFQRDH